MQQEGRHGSFYRSFPVADKVMKNLINKNTPQLAVILVGLFVAVSMLVLPSRTAAQCSQ